jgi:hypothetical protein
MNGILGSLPNSNRKIEPELMRRLLNDNQIVSLTASLPDEKGLNLLKNRPSVGSLSDTDEFSTEEMYRFLLNTQNIQDSVTTGSERFPGELLPPKRKNSIIPSEMVDLLVQFYKATYESLNFRKIFTGTQDSIIVLNRAHQYGRCRIGSELFGSDMSSRNVNSSFVLAQFENQDGSVDLYPGQVQYFFEHYVDLPSRGLVEHKLAYIRWYRPVSSAATRFYFSSDDEAETCNVELWDTEFSRIQRDCIIPVHNIFGRFIPSKYKISDHQNAREYLAIIPLNRKYHI